MSVKKWLLRHGVMDADLMRILPNYGVNDPEKDLGKLKPSQWKAIQDTIINQRRDDLKHLAAKQRLQKKFKKIEKLWKAQRSKKKAKSSKVSQVNGDNKKKGKKKGKYDTKDITKKNTKKHQKQQNKQKKESQRIDHEQKTHRKPSKHQKQKPIINKYNKEIVDELFGFGVGTKKEIIKASKECINSNDINAVQQKMEELQILKEREKRILNENDLNNILMDDKHKLYLWTIKVNKACSLIKIDLILNGNAPHHHMIYEIDKIKYSVNDTMLFILDLYLRQLVCYRNGKNKNILKEEIFDIDFKGRIYEYHYKLAISLYDAVTISYEQHANLQSLGENISSFNDVPSVLKDYYAFNYFGSIPTYFRDHLSMKEAQKLNTGNCINYRDENGKSIEVKVIETNGNRINIDSGIWNKWITKDNGRLAIYGQSSKGATWLNELKYNDYVLIKTFYGREWELGRIRNISYDDGQVEVNNWWTYLDNTKEINKYYYGPYDIYMKTKMHYLVYKKLRKQYELEQGINTEFIEHMKLEQAQKLRVGDDIDYREIDGKYVGATIIARNEQELHIKISNSSIWLNMKTNLNIIGIAGSISERFGLRFKDLKIGHIVAVNPMSKAGNACFFGVIKKLDNKSGQILVNYTDTKNDGLYWMHSDNKKEVFAKLDHDARFGDDQLCDEEIYDLEVGDKIDYRMDDGKYVIATIIPAPLISNKKKKSIYFQNYEKKKSIYFQTIDGDKIEFIINGNNNVLHKRLAKVGSITNRPAHRLKYLELRDYVIFKICLPQFSDDCTVWSIKWKIGQINCILSDCGQVQIEYKDTFRQNKHILIDKKYCWMHLDDIDDAYIEAYDNINNIKLDDVTFKRLKDEYKNYQFKPCTYNKDIVHQLSQFQCGTKEEIIKASKQCINPNDIIQVQEKMDELQEFKELTTTTNSDEKIMHIIDIDKIIGAYYKEMDVKYYDNYSNIGKFAMWCDDNGYDTDMIAEEVEDGHDDIQQYEIIEFDDEFPLSDILKKNRKSKEENVLNVILFCYKNGYHPKKDYLTILDFNLSINQENVEKCKKMVESHFFPTSTEIFELLSVGYDIDNYNFLMYLIDSYSRDRTYAYITNESIDATQWVKNNRILSIANKTVCNNIINVLRQVNKKMLCVSDVSVICDDMRIICQYIAELTKFIDLCLIKENYQSTPFQIDCMFIFDTVFLETMESIDDDGDDFDDDGDDFDDDGDDFDDDGDDFDDDFDFFGNIKQRLENSDCQYISTKYIQSGALRQFYDKFKAKFNNYTLHKKRMCILMDRRKTNGNEQEQFMYSPPKQSRSIANNYIHESMTNLSAQCLIPGQEENINKRVITSLDHCKGKLITFSFHIESPSIIRCYLYRNSGRLRFYPHDIVSILPNMFDKEKNKNFIQSQQIENIKHKIIIKDTQFEYFYNHLTNNKDMQFNENHMINIKQYLSWSQHYKLVMGYIRNISNQYLMIREVNNLIFRYYK